MVESSNIDEETLLRLVSERGVEILIGETARGAISHLLKTFIDWTLVLVSSKIVGFSSKRINSTYIFQIIFSR